GAEAGARTAGRRTQQSLRRCQEYGCDLHRPGRGRRRRSGDGAHRRPLPPLRAHDYRHAGEPLIGRIGTMAGAVFPGMAICCKNRAVGMGSAVSQKKEQIMINDIFIIDGVAHPYNWSMENKLDHVAPETYQGLLEFVYNTGHAPVESLE